jgi:hypothetical protein
MYRRAAQLNPVQFRHSKQEVSALYVIVAHPFGNVYDLELRSRVIVYRRLSFSGQDAPEYYMDGLLTGIEFGVDTSTFGRRVSRNSHPLSSGM